MLTLPPETKKASGEPTIEELASRDGISDVSNRVTRYAFGM